MARSRNIKPGFFSNDVLAELDPLTRLLFIGIWTLADRAGRLEDRPKRIKAEVMAYDNCDVGVMLDELQASGFILRYEAQGVRVIQVLTWDKHQNPHVKEAESTLPTPDQNSASTVQAGKTEQPKPERAGLIPDSGFLIPDTKAQPGFDRFWSVWPKSVRKEAKSKCLQAWRKAGAESQTDAVIAHVEKLKGTTGWTKDNGEFIPAPLTYLNQRRWEGADIEEDDPYELRRAA